MCHSFITDQSEFILMRELITRLSGFWRCYVDCQKCVLAQSVSTFLSYQINYLKAQLTWWIIGCFHCMQSHHLVLPISGRMAFEVNVMSESWLTVSRSFNHNSGESRICFPKARGRMHWMIFWDMLIQLGNVHFSLPNKCVFN